MKLDDQVTSLPLSQRLKELGVKQESLFCWLKVKEFIVWPSNKTNCADSCAFNVAELGMLLPSMTTSIRCHGKAGRWMCAYEKGMGLSGVDAYSDTEADCRAKILIYLLENKLIKLENDNVKSN